MQFPLISIIIPTYNSAKTVAKTILSILSQSFEDYEVLIFDSSSMDGTLDIIRDHVRNDPRVVLFSEKDKGVYDAMNKGIAKATGKWLYFLGSDDYLYDENVLKDVAFSLENNSADLVYGDAVLLRGGYRYGGEFDLLRIHTISNLCHQTIFYRKHNFEKIGGYNLKYHILADWDMNIRWFRHPDVITHHIDRVVVCFNNISGMSSLPHNDVFYKEVAVPYVKELAEKNELLNTKAYKFGRSVFEILEKTGIVWLFRKLSRNKSARS